MKLKGPLERRKFLRDSAVLLGASSLLGDGVRSWGLEPGEVSSSIEGRLTLSLNGEWEIEDSVSPDQIPQAFHRTVPVPGLAHLAKPGFPAVDMFQSREYLANLVSLGEVAESVLKSLGEDGVGLSGQERNYFWYRKTFRIPTRKEVALLKVSKAQFGTAVWLNGKKIAEHLGCFSSGYFNLTENLDWEGENTLLVRVGAHPAVLPKGVTAGTDFEKTKWTPGIYDTVSLLLSDNPVIETLQVAPRIDTSEIEVQAVVRNYANAARRFVLTHQVKTWRDQQDIARTAPQHLELQPQEQKTWTLKIRIPNARLWTPENPFLYSLETSTGGDSFATRFGMREFRFDTPTKRAYLNGKVYFLRGSNITLHRFFEDPKSGSLPWDEKWVRRLLIDIPKQMHWNSFRFCIGPVPDQWLDVADETGLLIQNEFFVWTGRPSWYNLYKGRRWDAEEMTRQYKEWMRDNWNHPSVAIWDANNETQDDIFADKIIPAVRSLDLSNRPWENSYNGPEGPNDPVEDHPYEFSNLMWGSGQPFKVSDLENISGFMPNAERPPHGHALILNEYGLPWLDRKGTPTRVSKKVYEFLLGPVSTAEERLALNAYLLSGLTEFWRAYRNYAGVLHFVYLTCSFPQAITGDHFRDVEALELEPHFKDYVGEAFKPLGVYLNFWQPTLDADSKRRFFVMTVNDEYVEAKGNLVLSLQGEDGKELLRRELPFAIPALGQQTYKFDLMIPDAPGKYLLKAAAYHAGRGHEGPTISCRKLSIVKKAG
jgi:hypothetical protein